MPLRNQGKHLRYSYIPRSIVNSKSELTPIKNFDIVKTIKKSGDTGL